MKLEFKFQFRKGETMWFAYAITNASPEEIAEYTASRTNPAIDEETGNPLYFTQFPVDNGTELRKGKNGYYPIKANQAEIDRLRAQIEQETIPELRALLIEKLRKLLGE